jgi:threonine/homoserine/homoserine lactone efflux protein
LSLLAVFLTAWVVGFSGAMAPGPISTLVVSQATRRGFWVGPIVTLGHAVAELVIVVALVMGLGEILAGSLLPALIALGGGGFLVWMGLGTLRDGLRGGVIAPPTEKPQSASHRWGPAWTGLAASFSNPYWFLWWSTVGATYIVHSLQHGARGVAAFYSGHILSDLSWNSLLSLLMASGRRWLPQGAVRVFLVATGIFLVGLGAYFAASGMPVIRGT